MKLIKKVLLVSITSFLVLLGVSSSSSVSVKALTSIEDFRDSVPVYYSFTPRWSSQSVLTPFGNGVETSKMVSLGVGISWRFPASMNSRGNFGVDITNVGVFKGRNIDLRMTVVDYSSTDLYVHFSKTFTADNTTISVAPTVPMADKYVTIQYSFYDHDTRNPVSVNGNLFLTSMTNGEYAEVDFSKSAAIYTGMGIVGNRFRGSSEPISAKNKAILCFSGSSYTVKYGSDAYGIQESPGIEMLDGSISFEPVTITRRYIDRQTGSFKDTEYKEQGGVSQTIDWGTPSGYSIRSVSVDSTQIENNWRYTFEYPYEDHIVTIYLDPLDYTIGYTLDGGENSPHNPDIYNINSNSIYLSNASRYGYDFTGWLDSPTGSPSSSIAHGSIGNRNFTATWKRRIHAITTSVVNGTITPSKSDVFEGDNFKVNYTKGANTYLKGIKVDGVPVNIKDYSTSYTFNKVEEVHSIAVEYAKNPVITISTKLGNTIIPEKMTPTILYKIEGVNHLGLPSVFYRVAEVVSGTTSINIKIPAGVWSISQVPSNDVSLNNVTATTNSSVVGSTLVVDTRNADSASGVFTVVESDYSGYTGNDLEVNKLK